MASIVPLGRGYFPHDSRHFVPGYHRASPPGQKPSPLKAIRIIRLWVEPGLSSVAPSGSLFRRLPLHCLDEATHESFRIDIEHDVYLPFAEARRHRIRINSGGAVARSVTDIDIHQNLLLIRYQGWIEVDSHCHFVPKKSASNQYQGQDETEKLPRRRGAGTTYDQSDFWKSLADLSRVAMLFHRINQFVPAQLGVQAEFVKVIERSEID
jgi:hypothetical protein